MALFQARHRRRLAELLRSAFAHEQYIAGQEAIRYFAGLLVSVELSMNPQFNEDAFYDDCGFNYPHRPISHTRVPPVPGEAAVVANPPAQPPIMHVGMAMQTGQAPTEAESVMARLVLYPSYMSDPVEAAIDRALATTVAQDDLGEHDGDDLGDLDDLEGEGG